MRTDEERPEENTCRIVKGLDAVWAYFCPSKPCLPLLTDGMCLDYNIFSAAFPLLLKVKRNLHKSRKNGNQHK